MNNSQNNNSLLSDLRAKITELINLDPSIQILQLNSNVIEKAFEAYVMGLCVKAVERAGGNFRIMGIENGENPNRIVFRGGPGAIYSRPPDFAYIACSLGEKEFEIHLDVIYEGNSGATHEIDVSFIDLNHANNARNSRRSPRYPLFIIECKLYNSSPPSIIPARTFVGLVSDFRPKIGNAIVSNNATRNFKIYLAKKNRPDPFPDLSTRNDISENRFVSYIMNKLAKWAAI